MKPWSLPMTIVLIGLSVVGVLVCIVATMALVCAMKDEGKVGVAVVVRAIGGGFWALAPLYLRRHPEWQAYLEEKF